MDARDPPLFRRLGLLPAEQIPDDVAPIDRVRGEVVVVDHAARALDCEPQTLVGEASVGVVEILGLTRGRMLEVLAHPATRGGNAGMARTLSERRTTARSVSA